MNEPFELILEDVYLASEPLQTQRLLVEPSSDQLRIMLVNAAGDALGYVCLEVAGNELVLDYSKPGDFPNNYTERIVLREIPT